MASRPGAAGAALDAERNEHGPRELLRHALEQSGLEPGPEQPCPYLPGRMARNLAFCASHMAPGLYHGLMDLNFRRSGSVFYQPVCRHCRQCRALRVPVDEFQPNRTQRRCRRRNRDLDVRIGRPQANQDKHRLYRDYLARRHDREMDDSWQGFSDFLYESPISTIEVVYRLAGRLVAVGIVDVEPRAMSTVYCYFDPELEDRSPGTFNVLWTIEHCRQQRRRHLYMGYYIRDCAKMNYKARFKPCETLRSDGNWGPVDQ